MQFGFMPRRETKDAIFIARQLQEITEKEKPFYFSFVDLEKAFDRVPRRVVRWTMTDEAKCGQVAKKQAWPCMN